MTITQTRTNDKLRQLIVGLELNIRDKRVQAYRSHTFKFWPDSHRCTVRYDLQPGDDVDPFDALLMLMEAHMPVTDDIEIVESVLYRRPLMSDGTEYEWYVGFNGIKDNN